MNDGGLYKTRYGRLLHGSGREPYRQVTVAETEKRALSRQRRCPTCKGNRRIHHGRYGAPEGIKCNDCQGTGYVATSPEKERCPICRGQGWLTFCDNYGIPEPSQKLCPACRGTGDASPITT